MLGYDVHCFDKSVFTWENVIHPDDYPRVMEYFESYINGDIDTYKIKYRCKKDDGSHLWIEDSGRIVERTSEGKVARMIGAHTDINDAIMAEDRLLRQNELLLTDNASLEALIEERTKELEELNVKLEKEVQQAEHNASFDVLTGTYNRRMFEEMFLKEVDRAKRYSHPLCLVLIDIDEFKLFNDNYGHKIGDEILCSIADILRQSLRQSDTLARWGGEEFIVILPNIDIDQAREKAEMIRKLIEKSKFSGSMNVTCSFGLTKYIDGESSDAVFIRTDRALYRAKDLGRNQTQVL